MRQFFSLWVLLVCTICGLGARADDRVDVSGTVRERETKGPVAGAVVLLSNGQSETRIESDADGRYRCRLAPGIITGKVLEAPAPLVKPLRAFRAPVELAADAHEQTLPPIELRPGRAVRGRVLDEGGKPVAGAAVQTAWWAFEPWLEGYVYGTKRLIAYSDEAGNFYFSGIDPIDDPRLAIRGPRFWAATADAATETAATLPPNPDDPVVLRLSRDESVALSGRVLDLAGRPVGGARFKVWTQWRTDDGFVLGQIPLFDLPGADVVTDSDGRFQTLGRFGSKAEYSLMISCEGYLPARGAWFQPGEAALAHAPYLRARRLRSVTGRVVDSGRRPLAGVRIFQSGDDVQRTEALSDKDGRFTLPDVAEGAAFVFAELAGYRFTGQPIATSDDTEVVLARDDEAARPLTLPPANVLDREEELALARQVIEADVERALHSGSRDERWNALYHWIRLDPADALERIDNGAIADLTGDERDVFRTQISRALVYGHPDDAVVVATSIDDADRRARALFELAGELPAADVAGKRALLNQALLDASHAGDPSSRALWQACVADAFLDLGDADRARTLLAEAGATAATLPLAGGGGSARRYIADVLSRTNLSAALALVKDAAEEQYRDRTFGKIAYRVAAQQPAEAERVLAMIDDSFRRESSTVRVCYRMAAVDGERARRLAEGVASPYLRALSLGWTARGFAISDSRRARETLAAAFAVLRLLAEADEGRFYGPQTAAVAAAVLLPVAEAIDPRLVSEYLWRAVSYRRSYSDYDNEDLLAETATLALLVAQYDREIARLVLEPVVDYMRRRAVNESGICDYAAVYAACAIDPKWAATLVQEQSSDRRYQRFSPGHFLASAIAVRPSIRTRILLENYFQDDYWLPGAPDNDFQIEF